MLQATFLDCEGIPIYATEASMFSGFGLLLPQCPEQQCQPLKRSTEAVQLGLHLLSLLLAFSSLNAPEGTSGSKDTSDSSF